VEWLFPQSSVCHTLEHKKNRPLLCTALLQRGILQLAQGLAQLVGTRRALHPAADALQSSDDIIDALSSNQLADALQVAIATADKEHLLYHVVLVSRHIDGPRTNPRRGV